ncbi:hypothetical protein OSB04_024393 [Centaurea solstitialis]|uniref:Uncharacterized protein n=1 Tax=Centaurea solstitialis TaxID=347529 RepID=A0AA38WDT6_9ASTR|nr:hypothetical protein OSB04_024393 [Centaurea solstitialis]
MDGISISFEHLGLRGPIELTDEEEEDSKQGGYAEFMIPKQSKGKEKVKEEDPELIYIAPIKHDPGSYSLPFSVYIKFEGLALIDTGAALNMMHVSYCSKMKIKNLTPTAYQYRGINGYMTTLLGIAEVVPIRIGKFVYLTDFIVADLPKNTEILIIIGRAGDKRIAFNPDGEPVTHLPASYVDPSQCFKENANCSLLPHEQIKKTEDYPNPVMHKEQIILDTGSSKKGHRKKKGSSARRAKK